MPVPAEIRGNMRAPGVHAKKPVRFRILRKYWVFYIMMLPTLAYFFLNNYLPMFGIIVAFKNYNLQEGFWGSPWVGFLNFEYLFKTRDAWTITRNTIAYNLSFIVLNLVIPIIFALMLNELRSRFFSKAYQTVLFLPYFMSPVVLSYVVFAFLGDFGFVNSTLLPFLGLESIQFYFETKWWPYIIPIINTWKWLPYYTIIYMAAMLSIDEEYYEAARIDGAGKWRQIWNITLPLIVPIMTIMTLLQIGRVMFADFGLFYLLPRESGMLFEVTNVLDTYVYRTFLAFGDIGLSSAANFYQAVVGFLLVFLSNWFVRRINKDNALF
jgi:putative aldouronate transport system permease protein